MKSRRRGGRGGGCPRVRGGEGQWTVGGHWKVLTFGPCGLPGVIQDVRGAQKKKKAVSNYTDGCCLEAAVSDTADREEGAEPGLGVTTPDERLRGCS